MRTKIHFLTRLPSLVLLAILFAATPALAASKGFLYGNGAFKPDQGSTWVERNWTGQYHFREVARTAQYVELYDQSRQVTVRLYAGESYYKTPQTNWVRLYHGRWDDRNKQPLNPNRLPGERVRLDNPTVRTEFPRLGGDYEVLGPATKTYNCIAWSIGITNQWVWPGARVEDFDRLYGANGYRRITTLDYSRQPGVDKIVLYGKRNPDGTWAATHGARQLADGSWSSKLGELPLIRHLDPNDVDGTVYGVPLAVFTRPHRA
jgi:hypothetical protein